jgi:hypothetical protein
MNKTTKYQWFCIIVKNKTIIFGNYKYIKKNLISGSNIEFLQVCRELNSITLIFMETW